MTTCTQPSINGIGEIPIEEFLMQLRIRQFVRRGRTRLRVAEC